jgi:hypothetical protein
MWGSTNREELLFLTVCAFPNASRMGFAWRICCSRLSTAWGPEAIAARYWITFFVFSVFPAPDSPLLLAGDCKNSRNEDGLIFAHFEHVMERDVGGGKDVRFCVSTTFFPIQFDIICTVDWYISVWIDSHQKQTRVGLR